MWTFVPEEVEFSMLAAIEAFGTLVLSDGDGSAARLDEKIIGRRLVQSVLGTDGGGEIPELLGELISDPDSQDGREALIHQAFAAFNAGGLRAAYQNGAALGRVAPTVAEIALIQNGREQRRPVDSHFGAWVVRVDEPAPFSVTAYDDGGIALSTISGD